MKFDFCNDCKWNIEGPKCGAGFSKTSQLRDVVFCGAHKKKKEEVIKADISKAVRHMNVCKELNELYESKNHDYGDSFAKVRKELGNTAILVRLYDKIERLKTLLLGAEQKVKDENIEDSFRDLANYCLMELVERQVDKNN